MTTAQKMCLCSEHLTTVQSITFWIVTPSNLDLNIQRNILPLVFRIDLVRPYFLPGQDHTVSKPRRLRYKHLQLWKTEISVYGIGDYWFCRSKWLDLHILILSKSCKLFHFSHRWHILLVTYFIVCVLMYSGHLHF